VAASNNRVHPTRSLPSTPLARKSTVHQVHKHYKRSLTKITPSGSIYYCLFAPYIYGVVLRAHSVRGESRIQRNTNREVATLPRLQTCLMPEKQLFFRFQFDGSTAVCYLTRRCLRNIWNILPLSCLSWFRHIKKAPTNSYLAIHLMPFDLSAKLWFCSFNNTPVSLRGPLSPASFLMSQRMFRWSKPPMFCHHLVTKSTKLTRA